MRINFFQNTLLESLGHGMALAGLLLLTACGGSGGSNSSTSAGITPQTGLSGCAANNSCSSNPDLQIGGDRPAQVQLPSNYTTSTQYPLLVMLHGYGDPVVAARQPIYLGLDTRIDSKQYVLVTPSGTESRSGQLFWNATPACCAFSDEDRQVDDVAYLRGLIEEAATNYSIDSERIGLFGHSNGGLMALRMVCEASDLVTSVVSLAGSTWEDDSSCAPAVEPVSVLTVHGTEDMTVPYTGGQFEGGGFPGALETARRFAAHAGCNSMPVMAPNLDVLAGITGAETEVLEYQNCNEGTDVTLWTLVGGSHVPFPWAENSLDMMVDWIVDHPRN